MDYDMCRFCQKQRSPLTPPHIALLVHTDIIVVVQY
jgi:hypothetical protein